jgi:hypothetical protein
MAMDQETKAKWLIKLARSLRDNLDPETAKGMAKILDDLTDTEFQAACIEISKKYKRIPAPATFFELARPAQDQFESIEAASRIIASIAKYGYNRFDEAKNYIGELGWTVVNRFGGWYSVCRSLTADNEGQKFAQYRDVAAAIIGREKLGLSQIPPKIKLELKFSEIGKIEFLEKTEKEDTNSCQKQV